MTKPEILIFCPYLNNRAGVERMTVQLSSLLADYARVRILSIESLRSGSSPYEIDPRVSVFSLGSRFNYSPLSLNAKNIRLFVNFIKKHRPDLVITVETPLLRISAPALAGTGIKNIGWEHFHLFAGSKLGTLFKMTAPWLADTTVLLTESDAKAFRRFRAPNLTVIPNFTYMGGAAPSPCTAKTALAIGRHAPEKGFDNLIRAWAQARPDGWILKIVGDGELRESNEALAATLGVRDSVLFLDSHSGIEKDFREASCFILSSKYEGIGLVLLEAKTMGLPVISFNCPFGPREVVRDSVDGWLVEDQNVEALAATLRARLRDPADLRPFGERGREDALARFSPAAASVKWLSAIRPLLPSFSL